MLAPTLKFLDLIVPGLLIAIFTSLLTVRLSIRKFHSERWWERKEQAYSNLLEIIYGYVSYTSKHLGDMFEPDQRSGEDKAKWEKDWRSYNEKYAKARGLASLHLSKKAIQILDQYDQEKQDARNDADWIDWMESDLSASKKCLKSLIDEAKHDLSVS